MPFKSEAQRKAIFATNPELGKEFAKKTKKKSKASKKRGKKK